MRSPAYSSATVTASAPHLLEARADASARLTLVPNGDGWALARRDGILLFEAPGIAGRQRCLEFARDRGVLALFS